MFRLAHSSISDPEERTNAWIEVGILLLLAVVPYYIYLALPVAQPQSFFQDSLQRIAISAPVCAVALYFMWRSEMAWPHFGLGKNFDGTGIGIFISALVVGLGLTSILSSAFYMTWPMSAEAAEQADRLFVTPKTVGDWIPLGLGLAVAAAAEELVIRGFLTIRLHDLIGNKVIAVLIPALLFAGYHLYQGVPSAMALGIEGVLFGWMQLSTRRLKSLILAHLILNVVFFTGWRLL